MNALVEFANVWSARWAEAMWGAVWQSAVLAGAVWVVTLCLRKRSAGVRFWLWMLVPLRLLVMPAVTVTVPVLPQAAAAVSARAEALHGEGIVALDADPVEPAPVIADEPIPVEGTVKAVPPVTAAPVAGPARVRPSFWTVLMASWCAGVVVFVVRLVRGWRKMMRVASRAREANDPALQSLVREASSFVGLRGAPKLLTTEESVSPFVTGVFRPAVVVPEKLTRKVSSDELLSVLAHEFAHVRRRDIAVGWILALCEAVYFFHPALHLAKRRLMFERECACDEMVLALGKSNRGVYARALVCAADVCASPDRGVSPIIVAAESFRDLKKRLILVDVIQAPRARLSRVSVALLAILVIVSAPGIVLTGASTAQVTSGSTAEIPAAVFKEPAEKVRYAGIVTNPTGRPLPGVRVRSDVSFHRPRGYEKGEAETVTDANGRFSLGSLPAIDKFKGTRRIFFDHPEYAIWLYTHAFNAKEDPSDLRISLVPQASVAGRVTDQQGNPVADAVLSAHVQFESEGRYYYIGLDEFNGFAGVSDADGRFVLGRIPAGARAHLRVAHRQYASYSTRDGYRQDIAPIRAGQEEMRIALEPGASIMGRLVRDGKPYLKKGVFVTAEGTGGRAWDHTDEEGRFELTGLRSGSFVVYVDNRDLDEKDFVFAPVSDVDAEPGAPAASVDLELTAGVIMSGRVSDEQSGGPVSDQAIVARLGANNDALVNGVSTDADGRYELRIPHGEYVLSTHGWKLGRFRQFKKAVHVKRGEDPSPMDMTISARPIVRGRLADAGGSPVEGIVKLGEEAKTAPDGSFEIPEPFGNPAEPQLGFAFDKERTLGKAFYWSFDDVDKELEIVVAPVVQIIGRLVDEEGHSVSDAEPRIGIGPNESGMTAYLGSPPWKASVKADGRFTIAPVPVGLPMSLSLEKTGFHGGATLPELMPGEVYDVEDVGVRPLVMSDKAVYTEGVPKGPPTQWNAAMSGRVLDEKGKPVRGASVHASLASSGSAQRDVTDRDGRFRLEKLPEDRKVRLYVYYDSYGHNAFPDIQTGRKDIELQIFPQGYKLHGKEAPELLVERWFNTEPIKLSDLRGKVLLLHIGAHISSYLTYVDKVQQVQEEFADRGLLLIGVHRRLDVLWPGPVGEDEIEDFVKKYKIDFPFAVDASTRGSECATEVLYDVKATPAMYLVDKKGILRCSPTRANLDEWIERLLAE